MLGQRALSRPSSIEEKACERKKYTEIGSNSPSIQ
jgi:hypothetical protein